MNKSTSNLRQTAAWAGMIGSSLFVLVFTLEDFLRPGYKPLEMVISALSLGPRGWIQITNFILLFVFSRGLATEFPTGKASRWGLILLTIIAALFVVSGPFVMDPAGTPQNQATVHGTVHGLVGGFVFLLMPIIIFVYLCRFRSDPNWRLLRGGTLFLGIIEAVAVLFFTAASKSPSAQISFAGWMGLIQRTALVPFMVWIFLFALGLLKRSQQD